MFMYYYVYIVDHVYIVNHSFYDVITSMCACTVQVRGYAVVTAYPLVFIAKTVIKYGV